MNEGRTAASVSLEQLLESLAGRNVSIDHHGRRKFCDNHPSDVILCIGEESSPTRDIILQIPDGGQACLWRDKLQKVHGVKGHRMEKEMNKGSTNRAAQPRSIGRSSFGTDLGMHEVGLWPSLAEPMPGHLLVFATVYRTIYSIIGAYIIARLAPFRPLGHALIGGAIGTVLSIIGAATWNPGLGPHWYPVALILVALPSAWVGGKLRLTQLGRQTAA